MEITEETKDLNYFKNNAEEDYIKVPISVLRYISELEKQQERSYSEEDMINFANFKTSNLMTHCDKKGMYLGTKMVLEIWFEQFKKK